MTNGTKKVLLHIIFISLFILMCSFFVLRIYNDREKEFSGILKEHRESLDRAREESKRLNIEVDRLTGINGDIGNKLNDLERVNKENLTVISRLKSDIDRVQNISISVNGGIEDIRKSIEEFRKSIEEKK